MATSGDGEQSRTVDEETQKLEKDSEVVFDEEHVEACVTNGQWDELEKYLSRFVTIDQEDLSVLIFFEIRKQKFLEALDGKDISKAVEVLRRDLKFFAYYNPEIFQEITMLLTLEDISLLDCMEVFSKGIHRALVPLDSHMDNVSGVELVESASTYRMVTQMDVLRFLKEHNSELQSITSNSIKNLGAITENVFAISHGTKVIDATKSLRIAFLNAVPIVKASGIREEDQKQLINGGGEEVIGTFSSTDLRGCHLSKLKSWLPLSALEFTETVSTSPLFAEQSDGNPKRELVTCEAESSLAKVIDKALTHHVHRVWVVDSQGLLVGLVSLTDIIKVLRLALMS